MKKNILFTHDDMDGAGCRIVFDLAFRECNEYSADVENEDDRAVIYNCTNNNVDDTVLRCIYNGGLIGSETTIWFGDIAPHWEVMEKLLMVTPRVKVFDHHPTNEYLNERLFGSKVLPVNSSGVPECGTSLMLRNFIAWKSIPEKSILLDFADTIRSYDTYEFKTTNNQMAKDLMTLFTLLGMEEFCRYYYYFLLANDKARYIISDGQMVFVKAKLDAEKRTIESITPDDVNTVYIRGHKTALLTKSVYANVSELAYVFLHKYTEYDMFIAASLANGGKFEIRTIRDDLDTGKEIASLAGGGGHPKASGAPISQKTMDTFISNLVDQLNGKHHCSRFKKIINSIFGGNK